MRRPLRILLVDDHPQVEGALMEALQRIGIEATIDMRIPRDRRIPYGCELPGGTDLEQYDLAVIDLELFANFRTPLRYSRDDLRGGSEVLPYLRREAPWIPVVALSSHFTSEVPEFLVTAGSFGFDGALPKDLLPTSQTEDFLLKRNTWDNLLAMALDLRRQAVIGDGLFESLSAVEVEPLGPVQARVSEEFESWEQVTKTIFFFARKVNLQPLKGGFSGALVFRAFVQLDIEGAHTEGVWLLKLDRSARKLHVEAQAHLRMARSGFDFARMVPLLWRGVVVEGGVAGLAYQFARGTVEAVEVLHSSGIEVLVSRVSPVLGEFYRERLNERSAARKILLDWCVFGDGFLGLLSGLEGAVLDLFRALLSNEDSSKLEEMVRHQKSLIHGDLHLGNIMLGENDLLIDFARSHAGPIAYDAAKLISDLLLRDGSLRVGGFPTWGDSGAAVNIVTEPLRVVFDLRDGDEELYNIFLSFFLIKALGYTDVLEEAKTWVRDIFTHS